MVEALKTPRRRARSDRTSPPGPLVLRICSTQREGQIIRLKSQKCTIGSGEHCTLRIRAVGVQPLHCILIRKAAQTIIRRWAADTRLNGASFTDAPLHAGDRLSIGPVEFEVLEPGTPSVPLGSPDDSLSTKSPDGVGKGDSLVEHLRAAKDLARKRTGKILRRLRQANLQIDQLNKELHESPSPREETLHLDEGGLGVRDGGEMPPAEQTLLKETQALLREEQANFEAARQRWRQEHDESDRALQTQQADFDRQTQELNALRTELQTGRQECERLTDQLQKERAQAERHSETVTREASDLERQREELTAARAELDSMREAVGKEREAAEADRRRYEELTEKLQQERGQAEQQSETVTREASDLERQREELAAARAELDSMREAVAKDREAAEADRRRYEELAEKLQQERVQAEQQSETVTREVSDLEHQREELAAARAELDSMREAVARDREAAEADRQRYEELTEKLQQERVQAEQQSETVTREASGLERQREELAAARVELDSMREAVARDREAAEADRRRHEELAEKLQQERVQAEQKSETVTREVSDLEHQREELAAARAEIDSMREAVGKEREAAEADRQRYEELTEKLRLERMHVEQQSETVAHEASDLERQREEFAATRAELDSMREAVGKEREAAEADRQHYEELTEKLRLERAQVEQQSETVTREASDLERQREELVAARAELDSMREAIGKEQEAAEAELESSEQLSSELEVDRDHLKKESERIAQEAAELRAEREAFAEEQHKWETAQLEAQRQIEQRAGQLDAQKEALASSRENWEALQDEAQNKLAARAEQLDARERELDERTAVREITRYAPNGSSGPPDSEGLGFLDDLQDANADDHSTSSHDLFRQMEGLSPSQTQPLSELTGLRGLLRERDSEEDETPIIMREQPENVRPSVSEILLADPVIADSFVRQTPEERPEHSQTANAPESDSDDDVSIEQYMAGLLARVNQGDPNASAATHSQQASEPRREEAQGLANAPLCQDGPREDPALDAFPTPEPPALVDPAGPRAIAPERAEDLVTLRELANLSAQSALDTHARSRLLKSVNTKLAVVVVALGTAAFLFYRWKVTPGNNTYYYMGLAVVLIAIFWGVQYAMLAGYAYFRDGRKRHTQPEPAPPANAPVEPSADANDGNTTNAERADAPQPSGTQSSGHLPQ